MPKLNRLGLQDLDALFVDPIIEKCKSGNYVAIASLGSGNCDLETRIAQKIIARGYRNFQICCYEINPAMIERGRKDAGANDVANLSFVVGDINYIRFSRQYDVFIANHSLHHFVRLEHIFESVRRNMADDGYFIVNDMIGRNGHMRWPEAYEVVSKLWQLLPEKQRWNHQLSRYEEKYENWDCSKEGFEGIRSQDILPLLLKNFYFEMFYGFGNIVDVFIDRGFGHNFDPADPVDRSFIDYVACLDESKIAAGVVKPTHMIGWLRKEQRYVARQMLIDNLTPEKSVRRP